MADATSLKQNYLLRNRDVTSWSAIFAGAFVFLAIEATFGLLGLAIFASASNPNAAHPVAGMSAGMGIWTVILSLIALYCAGRTAGHVSGVTDKLSGMYHGLVTFGLCIFSSVLVATMVIGSNSQSVSGTASAATVASMVATAGYWLFLTLLLGGIFAIVGGVNGATALPSLAELHDIDRTKLRSVA